MSKEEAQIPLVVTPRVKPQNRFFSVTTARPGGPFLLGHQATLRPRPRQTPPNKPNHKKKSPRVLFIYFCPFFRSPNPGAPHRTPPNPTELAGGTVSAAACVRGYSSSMCSWVPQTIFYLCPLFGRRPNPTEPHQTKPNHTEPAHTLTPKTEVEITGAGCFPVEAPRRNKRQPCGLTEGVTK